MTRPSGILLAGGASRRFGRPKVLEPVRGAPLFERPLRALLDSCDEVLIVLAPDDPDLPLPHGASRVRFVRDERPHEGPLAGARAGLEAVGAEYAALVAADMPGVRGELITLMASRVDMSKRRAVVLADPGGARPLPAVVAVGPARALAASLLDRGERRLRALVEALDAESLSEDRWRAADPAGAWRHDIDVPEDLAGGSP